MTEYCFDYVKEGKGKQAHKKMANQELQKKDELYVKYVKNATILPRTIDSSGKAWMGLGGVVDENRKWVSESGLYRCDGIKVFGGKYVTEYTNSQIAAEKVIYMGPFFPHWGHFLLDFIPRLWYAMENEDLKIVYCGWDCEKNELIGNYKELLGLLGLDIERFFDVRETVAFSEVIIPEPAFQRGAYYSDTYVRMKNTIIDSLGDMGLISYENIVFSRRKFGEKMKKEFGIKEIDELFEKNGFKIFYPEELSVKEQIFYVNRCNKFAVTPGGASMNGIFMKEGSEVIYLQKDNGEVEMNDLYLINEMNGIKKVTYVDVYFKLIQNLKIEYGSGPFWLGITKELERYAKSAGFVVESNQLFFRQSMKDKRNMFAYYIKREAMNLYSGFIKKIRRKGK